MSSPFRNPPPMRKGTSDIRLRINAMIPGEFLWLDLPQDDPKPEALRLTRIIRNEHRSREKAFCCKKLGRQMVVVRVL